MYKADTLMYQNERVRSSSRTLVTSRSHQLTIITAKAGSKHQDIYMKALIYIGCIKENATVTQFYAI